MLWKGRQIERMYRNKIKISIFDKYAALSLLVERTLGESTGSIALIGQGLWLGKNVLKVGEKTISYSVTSLLGLHRLLVLLQPWEENDRCTWSSASWFLHVISCCLWCFWCWYWWSREPCLLFKKLNEAKSKYSTYGIGVLCHCTIFETLTQSFVFSWIYSLVGSWSF